MSMLVVVVALALCTLSSSTPLWLRPKSNLVGSQVDEELFYRLPTNLVKPITYDVSLTPYFDVSPAGKEKFTFDGTVQINVQAVSEANWIRMHSYDITFEQKDVSLTKGDGTAIEIHNVTFSGDDRHFFDIFLLENENLVIGEFYTVSVTYVGKLNDDLEGFYRSKYIDKDGTEKWMGVTQFEQTGARRAFPCFDEPAMKAKFTISIAHSKENNVLSNMPQASDEPLSPPVTGLEEWKVAKFDESKEDMSTYLVAFTVSEFNSLVHPDDIRFKIWARPGAETQGEYANIVSPKIVDFMEKFTGHPYSFPKIDQIAIPDFSAGAMENWGLITYRESRLLFEEGVSTTEDRQLIEEVVAHELAHQWFGNIVSPSWWENIWLNEGFATFFEYHALKSVQDTWQLEQQFIIQQLHEVLRSDALNSTHPLLTVVTTPASSSAAFDNIAYNKGGCIVRFMIFVMSEESFKEGINLYLTAQEFSDATPTELWSSLSETIDNTRLPPDVDFATVMDTWNNQAGYPVVKVERDYEAAKPTVSFKQERFINFKDVNIEYNERWWVALTMTSETKKFDEDSILTWFFNDVTQFEIDATIKNENWILFNTKQYGYYRVNYDVQNWAMLSEALHTQMHDIEVINRAQLMDDALALARANFLDYNTALDTTGYLHLESEYAPWAAVIAATSFLKDRLSGDSGSRGLFEWYMLDKMSNVYDLVNGLTETEDDSHMMRTKRSIILASACDLGHPECNDEAVKLFKNWQENDVGVSPDLKSVVYCAGMREGGKTEYDFLFAKYLAASTANSASEQDLILKALGCATDETLLQQYLDESIKDNSQIRSQNARAVHSSVYNNYLGVNLALDFIITNWKKCETVYSGANNVGRAFTGVAAKLNTEEQKQKLVALLASPEATTMDGTIKKAVEDSITTVDETLIWQTGNRDIVVEYFRVKKADSGSISVLATPTLLLALIMALFTLFN